MRSRPSRPESPSHARKPAPADAVPARPLRERSHAARTPHLTDSTCRRASRSRAAGGCPRSRCASDCGREGGIAPVRGRLCGCCTGPPRCAAGAVPGLWSAPSVEVLERVGEQAVGAQVGVREGVDAAAGAERGHPVGVGGPRLGPLTAEHRPRQAVRRAGAPPPLHARCRRQLTAAPRGEDRRLDERSEATSPDRQLPEDPRARLAAGLRVPFCGCDEFAGVRQSLPA